jgi:hypothetical protein
MTADIDGLDRTAQSSVKQRAIIVAAIVFVIAGAIVRSSITTRLDSFTYDEAYHIGAGASYIQTGDFRLNPEQPPLTKLWVGAYVTLCGYEVSPFRAFADKEDERDFVEKDAYFKNDPFVLQSRARTAMVALNGLLIFLFALAAWRVFGAVAAIGLSLILAIDPTVAAHMPVVMTDLPIALTSGIAILTAARAFQTWKAVDILLSALSLGLALSAKHSGIITLVGITLIGVIVAFFFSNAGNWLIRLKRTGAVAVIVLGGVAVLWAFYGFHYYESPGSTTDETFNRSLYEKTTDIRSPLFRSAVLVASTLHIFPRAYIWGMADTIRAGVEGRAIQVRAFGTSYYAKAPWYFFPGIVAAKLPLGLLLLSLIGAIVLLFRKVPGNYNLPILIVTALTLIFLAFLIRGSSYAGVRHATPLFPFMILLGAIAIDWAIRTRSYLIETGVGLLLLAAIVSAVPQMRPWEYFNELAGGAENGYKYFNDEGVDLSQRIGEAARFYHAELEPIGDVPMLAYFSNGNDRRARGMDWIGKNPERDLKRLELETFTGTVLIGANELGENGWWDVGKPFRSIQPTRRMGNIFVYQGTFERPVAAISRYIFYRTIYSTIYTDQPDPHAAIEGIERSLALDNSCFFASLELGNQYLKIGDRDGALRAYRLSLSRAPKTDSIFDLIAGQIARLENEPLESITPLRNPGIE